MNEKEGILISRSETSKDEVLLKKEMEVDASVDRVMEILLDLEVRQKANSRIDVLEEITQLGTNSRIIYQKMIGNFIFNARDFCASSHSINLKNGSKLIVEFSIEHEDVPETKAVRGEFDNLFWIKKISADQSKIVNLLHLYLKGNLPGIAKGMIPKKHLEEFVSLRKKMEE